MLSNAEILLDTEGLYDRRVLPNGKDLPTTKSGWKRAVKVAEQLKNDATSAFREMHKQKTNAEAALHELKTKLKQAREIEDQKKQDLAQLSEAYKATSKDFCAFMGETGREISNLNGQLAKVRKDANKSAKRMERNGGYADSQKANAIIRATNGKVTQRIELEASAHKLYVSIEDKKRETKAAQMEIKGHQKLVGAEYREAKEQRRKLEEEYAKAKQAYHAICDQEKELKAKFEQSKRDWEITKGMAEAALSEIEKAEQGKNGN